MSIYYAKVKVFDRGATLVYKRKVELSGWQDTLRVAAMLIGRFVKLTVLDSTVVDNKSFQKCYSEWLKSPLFTTDGDLQAVVLDHEEFYSGVAHTKERAILAYDSVEDPEQVEIDEW